jgi:hypothetical protein
LLVSKLRNVRVLGVGVVKDGGCCWGGEDTRTRKLDWMQ